MFASYISAYHNMAQDKMWSRSLYNLQISLSDNPEKMTMGYIWGREVMCQNHQAVGLNTVVFPCFLEAKTWFCSQFLRDNVAYCLKITAGYIQYKSSVHFENDL